MKNIKIFWCLCLVIVVWTTIIFFVISVLLTFSTFSWVISLCLKIYTNMYLTTLSFLCWLTFVKYIHLNLLCQSQTGVSVQKWMSHLTKMSNLTKTAFLVGAVSRRYQKDENFDDVLNIQHNKSCYFDELLLYYIIKAPSLWCSILKYVFEQKKFERSLK